MPVTLPAYVTINQGKENDKEDALTVRYEDQYNKIR